MNPDARPAFISPLINLAGPRPDLPEGVESVGRLASEPLTNGTRLMFPPSHPPGLLVLAAAYDCRQSLEMRVISTHVDFTETIDLGFHSHGQRFHFWVPADARELLISLPDRDTFWVVNDSDAMPASGPMLWIHEQGIDVAARFRDRLADDCIAQFGWMGGCVLEALDTYAQHDTSGRWSNAFDRWLSFFLDDQHLHYQDARGRVIVDGFNTIEALLPIASIARRRPDHPIIDTALAFLLNHPEANVTCEGCYTVAYTLAQIGKIAGRPDLLKTAHDELARRRQRLCHEGTIWLRDHGDRRSYPNWARGIGWYLLGHLRCLELAGLDGEWSIVAKHLADRCEWVMRFQRPDGLWDNFLGERDLPADTSGSAAIATALVGARRLGLLGDDAFAAAIHCWKQLTNNLYLDGWLGGTSPSNKRGEAEQHGPQRTSETFGMGLMGQLDAALHMKCDLTVHRHV